MSEKKAGGRTRWAPTEAELKQIRLYAGLGVPIKDIGVLVGKSHVTLQARARDALEQGAAEANAKIAGALYRAAIGGNITAAIFWAKTRLGWHETSNLNLTGDKEVIINISRKPPVEN